MRCQRAHSTLLLLLAPLAPSPAGDSWSSGPGRREDEIRRFPGRLTKASDLCSLHNGRRRAGVLALTKVTDGTCESEGGSL